MKETNKQIQGNKALTIGAMICPLHVNKAGIAQCECGKKKHGK
jgi:hypothetical protein